MHLVLLKRKRKINDRTLHAPSELEIEKPPGNDNEVSISDAETQSGNEHSPSDNEKDNGDVHEDSKPNNKEPDNDVEIEPHVDLDIPQPKNQKYDKRDFIARKHGKEREPWVQKPMPFPPKSTKKNDDEEFEHFAEMLRPVFLHTRLTDILKMPPYAKYMKDIITNKRKTPKLKSPLCLLIILLKMEYLKNLEIREYQLYLAPSKEIM